jgi:hypothetical protein
MLINWIGNDSASCMTPSGRCSGTVVRYGGMKKGQAVNHLVTPSPFHLVIFQGSSPGPAVATGDENGGRHPVLTRGVRLCSGQFAMPYGRHGG